MWRNWRQLKTRANIASMSTRAKWILYCTGSIAGLNFLVFWVVTVSLGGDALNGYVQNGHYFLCAHGSCREVAPSMWTYSYWHAVSGFAGILLVFIEAAALVTAGDVVLDFDRRN